ncbi:helix-turn-helix transcriptional regulator [Aquipuribacter hungaricus]|uniref:Response regulator transcription factor n=1 Tax=Aquipuribacter hungaricus TaxID=545624 RepID=A0ABV7WFJ2_9MICO
MTSSGRDLAAALDFAAEAATVQDGEDVTGVLLPALCRLVDAPGAVVHEVDLAVAAEYNLFWPEALADGAVLAAYAAVMRSHPFFRLAVAGAELEGVRISDLMPRQQWRSSEVYGEALRFLWAEDQMTTFLSRQGTRAQGLSVVTDGRPFTERQRRLMLLVRPHVRAAVRRTHHPGASHRVLQVGTPSTWLAAPCGTSAATVVPGPRLTPAEQRVLTEAAAGLTSAQIARRVGAAPRTVEKHLEHAYGKLGVTNRVAALQVLGVPRQASPGDPRPTVVLPGCVLAG